MVRWRAMRRLTPTQIAAIAAAILLLVVLVLFLAPRGNPGQDRLADEQIQQNGKSAPEKRCGSQATYDLIKREIFRQAADTRGTDQAAFDRIAAGTTARMERPLFKSGEDDVGLIRCSGHLSLDLPPGLAVVGGRRTLAGDIDYIVQPAADGTGDVVMLQGADSIIVPLATLASIRTAAPAAAPPSMPTVEAAGDYAGPSPAAPSTPPPPSPAPRPQQSAAPSFDCRLARTAGEVAVCRDEGLAALDRQMAAQYRRAIAVADGRAAELLRRTRDAFLRYRDQCATDACVANSYRGRMREIDDIMAGNWRPGR